MKKKDIPRFKKKVLKLLPITQAEVWNTLGIDHRDGAKLISIMLNEKLIRRKKTGKTFLLKSIEKIEKKSRFSVLLSGNGFSPCCGCKEDCIAATCTQLTRWITDGEYPAQRAGYDAGKKVVGLYKGSAKPGMHDKNHTRINIGRSWLKSR